LSYDPEAVLWLGFTSKDSAVKERYNLFLKVWPAMRQQIPYALMQEMRITAELPSYGEIVQTIFLQLIDGKLTTPEEARAFLEPYSPPAPPPQVVIKRPRVKRVADAKVKGDSFDEESEVHVEDEEDLDDIPTVEDDVLDLGLALPKIGVEIDITEDSEADAGEDEDEEEDRAEKTVPKSVPVHGVPKAPAQPKPGKAVKPQPVAGLKAQPKQESKPAPAKAAPTLAKKPVPHSKPAAPKAHAKPQVKTKVKAKVKAASKPTAKTKAKALKSVSVKKKPVSTPSRKPAKPVKKR
jgi:hypothetical protein